jgi:hypothetical protein
MPKSVPPLLEKPHLCSMLRRIMVGNIVTRAQYDPEKWLGILRDSLLVIKGMNQEAAVETVRGYSKTPMTLLNLQRLTTRLSGNLARLKRGHVIAPVNLAGDAAETAMVKAVKRYPPEDEEKHGQMEFLILTGDYAGEVVPGIPSMRATKLVRMLDKQLRLIRRVDELLGCEFRAVVTVKEGHAIVGGSMEAKQPERQLAIELHRYRYARHIYFQFEKACMFSKSCLTCRRGQLATRTLWACDCAMRTTGIEPGKDEVSSKPAPSLEGFTPELVVDDEEGWALNPVEEPVHA